MILTGKCKDDFIEWYKKNYSYLSFQKFESEKDFNIHYKRESILINALIIEFFDSVGIYINISVTYGFNWNINEFGGEDYNNRQEADTEAIKKANDIYNETI